MMTEGKLQDFMDNLVEVGVTAFSDFTKELRKIGIGSTPTDNIPSKYVKSLGRRSAGEGNEEYFVAVGNKSIASVIVPA